MTGTLFPVRIETERLTFERLSPKTVDPFALYEFVSRDDWRDAATEHMPWFRFRRLDQVQEFLENAADQFDSGDTARYLLRNADGDIVGLTAFGPEWETRRAGSGIVLAEAYWGRGYGTERATVFVELAFERYDLGAYYSTCAAGNERSRRMIEGYVDRYGGRHEGLMRQHSARPSGEVTDQHRFSILREEYETATENRETTGFDLSW